MKIYCVYDIFAESAVMMFEQPNDFCAARSLKPMLNTQGTDFTTFRLDCLGDYDRSKPAIIPAHRTICTLQELIDDGAIGEVSHE